MELKQNYKHARSRVITINMTNQQGEMIKSTDTFRYDTKKE